MDNRETPLAPATGYRREDVAAGAGLECSSSALPAQQALREKWHRMLVEARAEEDHHKQAGELLAAAYMLGWRCALACLISDLDGTLKGPGAGNIQEEPRHE